MVVKIEAITECPCCHGARELKLHDARGRISFRICTHCMGKGEVKIDEPTKTKKAE